MACTSTSINKRLAQIRHSIEYTTSINKVKYISTRYEYNMNQYCMQKLIPTLAAALSSHMY